MNLQQSIKSKITIIIIVVVIAVVGGILLLQGTVRNQVLPIPPLPPNPPAIQEPFNSGNWDIPLNLAECKSNDYRTFVHESGSKSVIVKGLKDENCIVDYTIEDGDSYITYECIWSISPSEIVVATKNVQEECTEISSGGTIL